MAFNGTGSNVTSLNASNIASGTVGTARLASGTANSSTFLRGDSTWAAPASSGGAGPVTVVSSSSMFTSSGTYAVPTLAADEQLYALMIGGGGAGGSVGYGSNAPNRYIAPGGSGNVAMALLNKAGLGANVTYTIGAGGTGVTVGENEGGRSGNTGGDTQVFSNSYLLAGVNGGGGGAADANESSINVSTNTSVAVASQVYVYLDSNVVNAGVAAGLACSGRGSATLTTTFPQPVFLGGGSAAYSGSTARTANLTGAPTRTFTGAGGSGSTTGTGSAGSAPGGGGGGSARVNSGATGGAGAAGGVKFFVIKGVYDASAAFNGVFTL